jgi:uncharacterized hydrophobic protein (TIGR00271 family)
MPEQHEAPQHGREHWFRKLQVRCSNLLGVSLGRRQEVYQDLIATVSLLDLSYWLQIFFAAGIATLGLVMNSVAVIIGAMLISPLMGVILATGLAFAAGDVILAIRSIINLVLSCALAIGFAVLLVAGLPFKDMTSEIMARTEPSLLDLVIAIFSGALATVMTAKKSTGPMNSIPGVAIAVALMPPLCVVGYGIGLAVSLSGLTGMKIAWGGGLLFLTNLTAIMLMAMVVFTLLRVDNFGMRQEVAAWHQANSESRWVFEFLKRFKGLQRLRMSGTLANRFLVLAIPIILLLLPLSQSFAKLSQTITLKQRDNQITQTSRNLWETRLGKDAQDNIRSYIDQISVSRQAQQLIVQMTIFTSRSYSQEEQQRYTELLGTALKRDLNTIQLRLLQIPIASYELLQAKQQEPVTESSPVPTIAEYQAQFLTAIEGALRSFELPQSKQMLDYTIALDSRHPLTVKIVYLADAKISADAESLLQQNIRERLSQPSTDVQLQWVDAVPDAIRFDAYGNEVSTAGMQRLAAIAKILQQYPDLDLEITLPPINFGSKNLSIDRYKAIQQILQKRWSIKPTRIQLNLKQTALNQATASQSAPQAELRLQYHPPLVAPSPPSAFPASPTLPAPSASPTSPTSPSTPSNQ